MSLIGHGKMKKRKSMVEHPFGTMKRAMNAGYTLLKGKNKVKGEFGIIALTYNIKISFPLLYTNLDSWNSGFGIPVFLSGIPFYQIQGRK